MTNTDYLNKRLALIFKPVYVRVALLLMVVSYFYNLPVLKYSVQGDNEFRLFDIAGLVILYIIYINKPIVLFFIRSKTYLNTMNNFVMWCAVTLIFTLLFSVFMGRPLWFIKSLLYYYHMLAFFYTGVLMAMYLRDKKRYKLVAHLVLIFTILESVLVFIQHYGYVPFLWNSVYEEAYGGFLSGTLGPNKICLGMTMFISLVYAIGLFMQSQIKVNKILIIVAMLMSLAIIGISGSRTTYLALLIFLCYLFIMKTRKFIALSILLSLAVIVAFFFNLELIDTIVTTIENRVINKVSNPEAFNPASANVDVEQLYQDLGAGRDRIVLMYLDYIARNPYVIPFGIGVNNRLLIGSSAHNIYLSLINEVGLVGLFLYLKWLTSFLYLKFGKMSSLKMVLNGLVFAMLVTLYFGEHLYLYRSVFTILGYFILITILLIVPRYYFNNAKRK
ncbi:O-antigen ligase family protein [Lacinutrix mariniflava]|uniref:O-antigen ligase family protein n=1 Tax=Lacinutrix mariniflava TaxID=342955 RepID=UPI0006E1A902|nr:O-antigen ligase family protein [Lacinutrix mariniflava]